MRFRVVPTDAASEHDKLMASHVNYMFDNEYRHDDLMTLLRALPVWVPSHQARQPQAHGIPALVGEKSIDTSPQAGLEKVWDQMMPDRRLPLAILLWKLGLLEFGRASHMATMISTMAGGAPAIPKGAVILPIIDTSICYLAPKRKL
jgi:hypothetical protein